jgi:hypothetical protein
MSGPPAAGEIEISLFGRGFGEAIVAHLGDGRWMLVDSLVEENDEPVALRYLAEIGVDPSHVVLIVATHWHDDHVAGLAQVYAACPEALMVLPAALRSSEMDAFRGEARLYGTGRVSSGVGELDEISLLQMTEHRRSFRLGKINARLLSLEPRTHEHTVEVEAVSPSDADVVASLREVAGRRPGAGSERWVMPFEANDISVAIWLSVGPHRVLLGADLERHADPQRGWGAVLSSPVRLAGRAGLYKVAHHGAENAHHDEVWSTLLGEAPIATLSTWNRGAKLPRSGDVARILALTPEAYITSNLSRSPRSRPKMVERKVHERGALIRAAPKRAGQVRLRFDLVAPDASWRVELIDGAMRLADFEPSA